MKSRVLLVLVLLAAVVGLMASSAAAQQVTDPDPGPSPVVPTAPVPVPVVPVPCYIPKYDLNGDGRVNDVDMNQWKRWFLSPECQQGAGTCHEGMDMDGNGQIEFADLDMMFQHYRVCLTMPRPNDLPPR